MISVTPQRNCLRNRATIPEMTSTTAMSQSRKANMATFTSYIRVKTGSTPPVGSANPQLPSCPDRDPGMKGDMNQFGAGTPQSGPAEAQVVGICQDLLRIDTTNTGQTATSAGERVAAEYVAAQLDEVGLTPHLYESEPGRASVVARLAGGDRTSRSAAGARPPGRGAGRRGRVVGSTRSAGRSPTATSGAAARST